MQITHMSHVSDYKSLLKEENCILGYIQSCWLLTFFLNNLLLKQSSKFVHFECIWLFPLQLVYNMYRHFMIVSNFFLFPKEY